MKTIHLRSAVGGDGVLALRIPIGREQAGQEVTVTVEPSVATDEVAKARDLEWRQILRETYGAGAGLGLERQDPGQPTERESVE